MRLFRLFDLLDALRVRTRPVTAAELAGQFDVSIRTVYRDIADLQALGAPIQGEGGIGYQMDTGFFMPSLSFKRDELSAIALGTRMVIARTDTAMAGAASRAAAKIASALDRDARAEFLDSTIHSGPSDLKGTPHLEALRQAVHNRDKLHIRYTDLSGKTSVRTARPLGLTVFDQVWLLTIWCERAEDFRHLRLDRIADIANTGERFRQERGKRFGDCLANEGNET